VELPKSRLLEICRQAKEELDRLEKDLLAEEDDLDLWLYQDDLHAVGTNLVLQTDDTEEPDGEG
jgi:hypothetical protein